MERLKSECGGECVGHGTGVHWTFEPCPEPCDQRVLDWVTHLAKTEAGENAQEVCGFDGKHCMCLGEFVALVTARCIPIDTEMGKGCLYFAAYAYAGECSNWL